jgi:hypothetical protein
MLLMYRGCFRLWGFDARVRGSEHERYSVWLKRQVDGLFLDERIAMQMSVDNAIWPSVFDYEPEGSPTFTHPVLAPLVKADSDCGDEMWADLYRMNTRLVEVDRDSLCIAVEIFLPEHAIGR